MVALGWLTVASLAVLLHVVPAFLGVEWVAQRVARWALRVFVLSVALLAAGFFASDVPYIEGGATLVFASLCVYLVPTTMTIARALKNERRERAIARAFLITLALLLAVAILGLLFGFALRGRLSPQLLIGLPQAHAILAIGGWLSLLVFGVSARTLRAITGVKSRSQLLHIIPSTLVLLGVLCYAGGAATQIAWLSVAGIAFLCGGALAYSYDLLDILRRREHPNSAPQLFVACADVWLVGCVALGLGIAAGKPWGAALTYLSLVGWLGQMVNGHVLHIGVRLMITAMRGDEDETRPWLIVSRPLATASWICFQFAVAIGTAALLGSAGPIALMSAAAFGLAGWVTMAFAIAHAYLSLRRLGETVVHAA